MLILKLLWIFLEEQNLKIRLSSKFIWNRCKNCYQSLMHWVIIIMKKLVDLIFWINLANKMHWGNFSKYIRPKTYKHIVSRFRKLKWICSQVRLFWELTYKLDEMIVDNAIKRRNIDVFIIRRRFAERITVRVSK